MFVLVKKSTNLSWTISSHEPPCSTHFETYNTLISMWTWILCAKEDNVEFHRRSCIIGDCHSWGIELLKVCLKELCINKKTQWRSVGHEVAGKFFEGWEKKVSRLLYNDTTPFELIKYLKPRLSKFVVHNFISHWQENMFKHYIKHISKDNEISCIYFSKNYGMKVHNEIQNMHWFSFQIIVLVNITYLS
jgi:hypothetical protein